MKNSTYFFLRPLFTIFFNLIFLFTAAQKTSSIVDVFENYVEAPRELVYVQLNKSTYIEGEMMGFKAYVFDKFTKAPSKMTRNLYCTISNKNGTVIKKKLVKVDDGVAMNTFDIDSTIASGVFTFKAYTNWMRNFDENNHYEQTFKVIDADNLGDIKPVNPSDFKIDLQVLGEGGHILYGSQNTIGIIAKNQFGYGIANAYGNITNATTNEILSEFQLNEVGLAKVIFTPNKGQDYNVNLNLNERKITNKIDNIKTNGLIMSLTELQDKVSIQVRTNNESLPKLKNKSFKIGLNNGSDIVVIPFSLSKDGAAILSFPKDELFSGINIFTIFTRDNQPILERLYFNNTIQNKNLNGAIVTAVKDSLKVTLKPNNIDPSKWSNLSISVLPSNTKSYNHHNNLLSQLYIQPYVNGRLENAGDYFKSNDRETAFNLDLLMLTQGWSSYNWSTIFADNEIAYIYPFERGIDIVANINGQKNGSYIIYPFSQNSTQLFDVPKGEDSFTIKNTFPTDDDIFRVGYIDTKKKEFKEKPSLYPQFYPQKFPDFTKDYNPVEETFTAVETSINPDQNTAAWENSKTNLLDEVVIEGTKKNTKLESLKNKAINSRINEIPENIKYRNMRLDLYLQMLGWRTDFDIFTGNLSITNPRVQRGNPVPLVYLDNALLSGSGINSDFSVLTFLTMNMIDYIEDDRYGIGGGIRGNAGYIKIFTSPEAYSKPRTDNTKAYGIPLKFSKNKQFYTPKYQYYNTEFFNEYGTIAWEPNLKFDENGSNEFIFFDTNTPNITLFIEGIVNNNEYVSQQIEIESGN
ncbi:MAG: hypothetical protein ED556_03870 [Winogradskyella sp.]|uniref:hypothetical protein n=1 Tax=Winogradskyella sp. TaxID=1883156 RepID=UPI000F3D0E39|nr:hypothetical protein [Winogradskyella sp.]RNC88332.1 MAG: hypothetical protein ED556_03870 [Winogradskyella sp.]